MATPEIFRKYADFYDAYYAEKDYEKEVDFVLALAGRHGLKKVTSILDIGCGTGGHIIPFCRKGLTARGLDRSPSMIEIAQNKIMSAGFQSHAEAQVGDATTFRDGKVYDIVVSMFAVMGYLNTNEGVLSGFQTARAHLPQGGLFVFDVWFGPTVLSELPETRIQEFVFDGYKTIRLVEPHLDVNQSIVRVKFTIMKFLSSDRVEEIHELHYMRYFFIQELMLLLKLARFDLVGVYPFLDETREPKLGDWNISVVAKAA